MHVVTTPTVLQRPWISQKTKTRLVDQKESVHARIHPVVARRNMTSNQLNKRKEVFSDSSAWQCGIFFLSLSLCLKGRTQKAPLTDSRNKKQSKRRQRTQICNTRLKSLRKKASQQVDHIQGKREKVLRPSLKTPTGREETRHDDGKKKHSSSRARQQCSSSNGRAHNSRAKGERRRANRRSASADGQTPAVRPSVRPSHSRWGSCTLNTAGHGVDTVQYMST